MCVVHPPLGKTTVLKFGNAIWVLVCLLPLNGEFTVWLVSSHLPLALSFWICIVRVSSHRPTGPVALSKASSSTLMYVHSGELLPPCPHPLQSSSLAPEVWVIYIHHDPWKHVLLLLVCTNSHILFITTQRFQVILPEFPFIWTLYP